MRISKTAGRSGGIEGPRVGRRHVDPRLPNYRDRSEVESRTRIRRPAERWEGQGEASRLAQIVVLQHGGHERPIITRGGKHLRSRMGSRKTGQQQVIEGRGHRDLTMYNESNPDVLDYQAHPFHIRGALDGEQFDYYPDHIRLMRNGTIELIEVKRTPADLHKDGYVEKLAAVAEICRRIGWRFRVLYDADIAGPPARMRNVSAIYGRRFLRVSRPEQDAISAFVAAGFPSTWSALRNAAAPGDRRRGNAVLENAIALGRIAVDLDSVIQDGTLVTPLPPVASRRDIRI